jgi:RNA polymerase sigma factor (TIGR02999 family)
MHAGRDGILLGDAARARVGDSPGRPSAAVSMNDVTRILSAVEQGDVGASERLLPLVYDELRKLAARRLAQEKPGQTLQATALVHEAYLRLVDAEGGVQWHGRGHFFAAAAEAMRRILVDSARRKRRPKHGGDQKRVELDDAGDAIAAPIEDLLTLDDALRKLTSVDRVSADLVKLRYFAGLSIDDAAGALGMSPRTADRRWSYARAWLRQEMLGE